MSFRLDGRAAMKRKLDSADRNFPRVVEDALYVEVEVEVTEVKRRTPVDTGELRASIHQEGPTRRGRQLSTAVVAGGPAAPYAVYVHEDLDAYHKVGQAKYIESTLLESAPHLLARIARRVNLRRAIS